MESAPVTARTTLASLAPSAAPSPATADRAAVVTHLATPPLPCLVPAGVFDAFAWCPSDALEWRRPAAAWDMAPCVDGSNPARMVFVMRGPCDFLPKELARLHAVGLGLGEEQALAPWGIDDATDELHAHAARPGDVLWLAADNLNALFWGLHDWAHFHNHGPFERRAWTELQCDASALAWLWLNRARIGLAEATWTELAARAAEVAHGRFAGLGEFAGLAARLTDEGGASAAAAEDAAVTRREVDAVLTRALQALPSVG